MRKRVSFFSFMVFIFSFSFFSINASAVEEGEVSSEQELDTFISSELEFYFGTAGYLDEQGNYVVTDIQAIEERMLISGRVGESAKEFYEHIIIPNQKPVAYAFNWKEYASCVVINTIPGGSVAWEIGKAASASDAFINALSAHNWSKAGSILEDIARKKLSKAAFKQFAKINFVVGIASSAVSCAL